MTEQEGSNLKLMRFWLVGVFVIIAAAMITMGFVIPGLIRETLFWVSLLATAVLTLVWFYIYRWWVARQSN